MTRFTFEEINLLLQGRHKGCYGSRHESRPAVYGK